MKLPRRRFLHIAAGASAFAATSRIARAQTFPNRPVRIVSGFPPGGINDTYARLIGQWLTERLGQSFIRREPVRRRRQSRVGIGRESGARRLHAAACHFGRRLEHDAL
jgi:hypothetical protein